MKRTLYAALLALPLAALAAGPATDITIDFAARTAPAQEVYQANAKTFNVTLKNAGATVNMTNYTPFFYWANSNTAAAIVTAACTVVSTTGGTFTATFTPAGLNSAGTKIYGVGLTSNNVTVARQGAMVITPDPYAANVAPVTYTTNINWALINWSNLAMPYTAITNAPWLVSGSVTNVAYATNTESAAAYNIATQAIAYATNTFYAIMNCGPIAFTATNYNATLTMDCASFKSLDVTNAMSGGMTLTLTNMVAGTPYTVTVRTDASPHLFTLAFGPTNTTYIATGCFTSTTIPARSVMIVQAQKMVNGNYIFSTMGAQ